ncbi:HxlR family transcriptional regulator [Neorhizobium sp. JUb45]|nr:helix-turn-helix domain-containing protein [Neorhizobium sp. JUb45]TCQ99056.1 HxlR family transcriptional regulator [Neorhizobium sp. JUb45]
MKKISFGEMQCPIARGLERVGERWTMLILRDAFNGLTRFDEFEENLGIAPNILTARLKALVEAGLLEKRRYCDRPPRNEYIVTERGWDFRPVMLMLQSWATTHYAPEGKSVVLINRQTGLEADPTVVDAVSGLPISDPVFRLVPGPAANERTRKRYEGRS